MSKEFDELKKLIFEDEDEEGSLEDNPNVELSNPTLEEPENEEPEDKDEEPEDKDENHLEKFAASVRKSIAEEHEAASNYMERASKCEKHGMDDAAKLFRDIADEEMVHVGEFEALLNKYDLGNAEAVAQGEQEAEEILGTDEEPVDEAAEPHREAVINKFCNYIRTCLEGVKILDSATVEDLTRYVYNENVFFNMLAQNQDPSYGNLERNPNFQEPRKRAKTLNQKDAIMTPEEREYFWNLNDNRHWTLAKEVAKRLAPEILKNESTNEAVIKEVTQDEWNKTPDDYKMIKNGEKYMVYLDPERHATVLGKVKIVDKKVDEELDSVRTHLINRLKENGWENLTPDEVDQEIQKMQKKNWYDSYTLDMTLLYHLKEFGNDLTKADSENESEDRKTVNEETTEYLEKGEIHNRLIQLLDLTTNEDTKAVALLSDIINFLDVDQAQSFYEFIQEETDMNYNEVFGSEKESADEDAFSGLKEHFMQYLSDIDKTKAPGYYKNTFKLDKDHEDYKRVLVVEIAKSYLEGKDLQAPLQAQFNVEHEIEENFEKWLEEFQSDNTVDEDGSVASLGSAPTVVAGKGIVTAEPTKMCEELKALQDLLK